MQIMPEYIPNVGYPKTAYTLREAREGIAFNTNKPTQRYAFTQPHLPHKLKNDTNKTIYRMQLTFLLTSTRALWEEKTVQEACISLATHDYGGRVHDMPSLPLSTLMDFSSCWLVDPEDNVLSSDS